MENDIIVSESSEPAILNKEENRSRLWEVVAVLLLTAAPTLASWGCYLSWGGEFLNHQENEQNAIIRTSLDYNISSMNTIFSKMRFVPIILFLMWRSKEGWASFGLVKPQFLKDIMIGIGLSLMIVFIEGVISPFFSSHHVLKFHWNFFYPAPVPPNIAFLLLLSSCSIAFSEELVTRSYLIPRFEKIMGNSGVAIFITSILFGLMHSYHGFGSVVKSFLSACIWGIVFCKTRRIWPVFLSHSLIDYIVATHLHTFIGLW